MKVPGGFDEFLSVVVYSEYAFSLDFGLSCSGVFGLVACLITVHGLRVLPHGGQLFRSGLHGRCRRLSSSPSKRRSIGHAPGDMAILLSAVRFDVNATWTAQTTGTDHLTPT